MISGQINAFTPVDNAAHDSRFGPLHSNFIWTSKEQMFCTQKILNTRKLLSATKSVKSFCHFWMLSCIGAICWPAVQWLHKVPQKGLNIKLKLLHASFATSEQLKVIWICNSSITKNLIYTILKLFILFSSYSSVKQTLTWTTLSTECKENPLI